ncbi:hypothetical protein RHS01_05318 [Rhizoctonia solani]|uniref:DUF2264 domain-containing protein n=1 Tax=Rhizoctonia solani TaxID=456999 RepID=A0A8H7IED3_9AGAM|nr:hypothetical protein RHS01_05318 [Rhizoctonia solani]
MPAPEGFVNNKFRTWEDVQRAAVSVLDSLSRYTSPGGARIVLGHTGTHFDEVAAQLEGFSRPLWALASLIAGSKGHDVSRLSPTPSELSTRWLKGLASGTDPKNAEYWGTTRGKDQRMVEMSAIGFTLAIAGEKLWDPLSEKEKSNLANWLGEINDKEMPDTNWLWFRVFANLGLRSVGSDRFSKEQMTKDLDHLDTFQLENLGDEPAASIDGTLSIPGLDAATAGITAPRSRGWSRDGPEGVRQLDYYSSSFAIQFAQLVYSRLAKDFDPIRCKKYKVRAREFAREFVAYFDETGRAIPFGRSMIYRAASASFWPAMAFANVEPPAPLTWGHIKGLYLRNLRSWAALGDQIWSDLGALTIGYAYPNMYMSENYNSPGSPYWFCKIFVGVGVRPDHPMWTAQESGHPGCGSKSLTPSTIALDHPGHILTHSGGHTFLLSSGQACHYPLKHTCEKYGKFAYSSAFGFSVPTGAYTLEQHALDSTLGLSDDNGDRWRVRRLAPDARIERGHCRDLVDTSLTRSTALVPSCPPNSRAEGRGLKSADGGWAIYDRGRDHRAISGEARFEQGLEARAISSAGAVGIVALEASSERFARVVDADSNSNIIFARSVIPTLLGEITGNDMWYVTGVFGQPATGGFHKPGHGPGPRAGWEEEWKLRPVIPEATNLSDIVKDVLRM